MINPRKGKKQIRREKRQQLCANVTKVGGVYSSKQIMERLVAEGYGSHQMMPVSTTSIGQTLRGDKRWVMVRRGESRSVFNWRRVQ